LNNSAFPTDLVAYEATGKDVFDLLDRISTNAIKALPMDASATTILINEKARIVDILTIFKRSETAALIVSQNYADTIAWIDRFVFTEDISFRQLTEQAVLAMPKQNTLAYPNQISGLSFTYIVLEKATLQDVLAKEKIELKSAAEFTQFRIEQCIGSLGYEYVADFIPLEVALLDAIDFKKGCYIGQEVIARLDTYKKVSKYLVQLESDESLNSDAQYTVLSQDGKKLGKVTTHGLRNKHLAVVHKSLTEPSTIVKLSSETHETTGKVVHAITDKTYQ
jgi:folate-binding protein YgfZ